MIRGKRVILRPIQDQDWDIFEQWAQSREALWGPFQRFQMDHITQLRQAYQESKLLTREAGFLLIETIENPQVVGFVRYTLLHFPDADIPYPEIGFGIPETGARRKGYAQEATALLLEYLFGGYPTERIAAFTDVDNLPAQHVLEKAGFQREGTLRRASFRDGQWRDIAIYSVLRMDWKQE